MGREAVLGTLLCYAFVAGCAVSGADRGFDGVAMPERVEAELARARRDGETANIPAGCRRLWGLSTLGTTTRAVATCSVHESAGPGQLSQGGLAPRKYAVLFDEGGAETLAHTDAHLGRILAPIEDWQSALAIAALRYPLWEGPRDGQGFRWKPIVEPLPAPSVSASGADWIVHWPTYAVFGCDHDLWMSTVVVRRDGTTEFDRAKTLRVATAEANVCVD